MSGNYNFDGLFNIELTGRGKEYMVCKDCSEVIDAIMFWSPTHVDYVLEGTEKRFYPVVTDDFDMGDVEPNGDINYYCPHCNETYLECRYQHDAFESWAMERVMNYIRDRR